jgi:hypothetical protein
MWLDVLGASVGVPAASPTKPGESSELRRVLGQPGAKIATASLELVGVRLGLPVDRVVAPTVAASGHREGITPARSVALELSDGASQLGLQSVSHPVPLNRLHRTNPVAVGSSVADARRRPV